MRSKTSSTKHTFLLVEVNVKMALKTKTEYTVNCGERISHYLRDDEFLGLFVCGSGRGEEGRVGQLSGSLIQTNDVRTKTTHLHIHKRQKI